MKSKYNKGLNMYKAFLVALFSGVCVSAAADSQGLPPPYPAPNQSAPPPNTVYYPSPGVVYQQAPVVVQEQVTPPQVVMPPGVVYLAPTYPIPEVGFVWSYHPGHGWGWFHPERGWHRGWR